MIWFIPLVCTYYMQGKSDHLTLLKAYDGWVNAKSRGGERAYCMTHFLSSNAMRMIASSKKQFVDLLLEIGFLQSSKDVYVDHRTGRGGDSGRGHGGRRGNFTPIRRSL